MSVREILEFSDSSVCINYQYFFVKFYSACKTNLIAEEVAKVSEAKYASMQVCKHASIQAWRYASRLVGQYVGLQEYKKGVSGFFQGFQRHLY